MPFDSGGGNCSRQTTRLLRLKALKPMPAVFCIAAAVSGADTAACVAAGNAPSHAHKEGAVPA